MDALYFVSQKATRRDFVLVKTAGSYLHMVRFLQVGTTVLSCELRSTSDRYETEGVVREQRYGRDGVYVNLEVNDRLYTQLEKIVKTSLRQKVFDKYSKLS